MSAPSVIVPKVMEAIRWITEGKLPVEARELTGLSHAQWNKWTKIEPLATFLAEAMTDGRDHMAQMLVRMDKDPTMPVDPRWGKIISENIKWYLSKMDTRRYGDKVQIDHHISADKEILMALDRAKERSTAIEGEATRITAKALPHPTRGERLAEAHGEAITDIELDTGLTPDEQLALDMAELL